MIYNLRIAMLSHHNRGTVSGLHSSLTSGALCEQRQLIVFCPSKDFYGAAMVDARRMLAIELPKRVVVHLHHAAEIAELIAARLREVLGSECQV